MEFNEILLHDVFIAMITNCSTGFGESLLPNSLGLSLAGAAVYVKREYWTFNYIYYYYYYYYWTFTFASFHLCIFFSLSLSLLSSQYYSFSILFPSCFTNLYFNIIVIIWKISFILLYETSNIHIGN